MNEKKNEEIMNLENKELQNLTNDENQVEIKKEEIKKEEIKKISQSGYKAGFVAIVGDPNAGKSTLMNVLIQEKVSIVTPKPQTTRQRINGILSQEDMQIIFVDSPGILKSQTGVNSFICEEYLDVMKTSDLLVLLIGADQKIERAREVIDLVKKQNKAFTILVSKIDELQTDIVELRQLILDAGCEFNCISAKQRPEEAREILLGLIKTALPEAKAPLYDPELYTTQNMREMCAEIIREKCFLNLQKEVPYGLAVKIQSYTEGDLTRIQADIIIERSSHKGIVIGQGGQMLKKIGMESRLEIEKLFGIRVYLELHVQVKENWTSNKHMMKDLGYKVTENRI